MTGTSEYIAWFNMKKRCYDIKDNRYKNYGKRGIKVCKKWMKFEEFIKDMGLKPSLKHSLDRIDNNGNYKPGNCRWATDALQSNNRTSNTKITFKNKTKTMAEWAEFLGFKQSTLCMRLTKYKWPIEKAFTRPIGRWIDGK
jgi:hypothetical protein